jgi:hypothetical protein
MVYELGKAGVVPVPSRMSVYRVLVRHGLVEPGPRKRPRDSYLRWERDEPMALWQLDIVGGAFLADGTTPAVVAAVRQLAPVRHPAQERPARPDPGSLQGQSKWSGKTLADHRADRKEWLLRTLGVSATDPARYAWETRRAD